MRKKLKLSKETLKTLSRKQLQQVSGGMEPDDGYGDPAVMGRGSLDGCNML